MGRGVNPVHIETSPTQYQPGAAVHKAVSLIEWQAVEGSDRIVAEAYDPVEERIYVRFPNGVEWWYAASPPATWEEFTAAGQSRGQYIHDVLNHRPNGRHTG